MERQRGIFPPYFSIPKGNPAKKLKSIKKEFEKFQKNKDYFISNDVSEYSIFSREVKSIIRGIIWGKNLQREEGHFFSNHYFSYQEGIGNFPDKFVVINDLIEGEVDNSSKLMEIDDKEAEKQKEKGVKTISNQKVEKEQLELENKKDEDKKEAENKLNAIQASQLKKNNDKRDKGGNVGSFLFGGSVSLLAFGLFLVGTIR